MDKSSNDKMAKVGASDASTRKIIFDFVCDVAGRVCYYNRNFKCNLKACVLDKRFLRTAYCVLAVCYVRSLTS